MKIITNTILLLLLNLFVNAQDINYGKLKGIVTGIENEAVSNAKVKLFDEKNNYLFSTFTNDSGYYEFSNLVDTLIYSINFYASNGRVFSWSKIVVVKGLNTFLDVKIGTPCNFYYGTSCPNCRICRKQSRVIPIKYVVCFGEVKPYIKKNKYYKCYDKSLCFSDWYCSRCKIEL